MLDSVLDFARQRLPEALALRLPSPPDAPPLVREGLPGVGPAQAYGEDPLGFLRRSRERYGDVFTVDLLLHRATFVIGPEANKAYYEAADEDLDLDEGVARFLRALMGPKESYERLTAFVPTIHDRIRAEFMEENALHEKRDHILDEARTTFARWAEMESFDLFRESSRMVMRMNIRALFDADILERFGDTLLDAYYEIEEHGLAPQTIVFPDSPLPSPRKTAAARATIVRVLETIRSERATRRGDDYFQRWLDQPLPDGQIADDAELQAHVLSLLFAAHTNTTGTMAWTFAYSAAQREIADAIRAEQAEYVAEFGDDFTFRSMQRLRYLDGAMKEAVRLHFALSLVRRAMRPWPCGDYVIPEGHIVSICPILVHTDPNVFPEPERFLPERWLDADDRRRWLRERAYVQFGYGGHKCLGEMFANSVLKPSWSLFFREYEMELEGGLQPPDWTKALGTPFSATPTRARVKRR